MALVDCSLRNFSEEGLCRNFLQRNSIYDFIKGERPSFVSNRDQTTTLQVI